MAEETRGGGLRLRRKPWAVVHTPMTYHCPRCGRAIREPLVLAHAKAEEYLIGLIRRDHPEWRQPDGACPNCQAYYRTLVERTGV